MRACLSYSSACCSQNSSAGCTNMFRAGTALRASHHHSATVLSPTPCNTNLICATIVYIQEEAVQSNFPAAVLPSQEGRHSTRPAHKRTLPDTSAALRAATPHSATCCSCMRCQASSSAVWRHDRRPLLKRGRCAAIISSSLPQLRSASAATAKQTTPACCRRDATTRSAGPAVCTSPARPSAARCAGNHGT